MLVGLLEYLVCNDLENHTFLKDHFAHIFQMMGLVSVI